MDGEACHCVLAIELSPDRKRMRIEEESLAHESKHIFQSMQGTRSNSIVTTTAKALPFLVTGSYPESGC